MFVQDGAAKSYLRRPLRRRGWGRIALVTGALLLASARLVYGSAPAHFDRAVVGQGDSVWSIAQAHYAGDPRPHVDSILRTNHLSSPVVFPGQTLLLPGD
ncbi:MAG: LysM peptidoglycan-binding domain-containing protein [Chloroflexi bacterium]|nr:MAG: LysM peptidoglycan-binding domain-containing protein [Chloroflexota bacterium]